MDNELVKSIRVVESMKVLERQIVELCEGMDKENYDILKRTFRDWSMSVGSRMEDSYLGMESLSKKMENMTISGDKQDE